MLGGDTQQINMKHFYYDEDIEKKDLDGKSWRKVLAHDDDLMACHLWFDGGAVGTVHTHPHTQIAYIVSGRFEFTVGEETHTVNAGDSVLIPSGMSHGLLCLEKGELIDIFTPERKDFLS